MKLKHYDHNGNARFVTFCTHKIIPLLTNNKFQNILIQSIEHIRSDYKLRLTGFVLMPEHVHLVLIPRIETKIGEIIGEIKRVSAKQILALVTNEDIMAKLYVEQNRRGNYSLWQRRCYDHNCGNEEYMWQKVNYCHYKPVKRNLVSRASYWK